MSDPALWTGSIVVRRADAPAADRLWRALTPEAAREVPRAQATVERDGERAIRVALVARDTGAVRAAVNTYLGWISLADRTETAVGHDRRAGAD